jgi:hypothetical protein
LTTSELLSHLRSLGVRIWVDGDQLRYRSPKGRVSPELRAQVGARKAEIIAFLREVTGSRRALPPLVPRPRDGDIPLSFAQQRLWFLDRLQPGSTSYNLPAAVRMTGSLDVAALRRSLDAVVHRHESLRTTFADRDGRPVQVIAPEMTVTVPLIDLSSLPDGARAQETQRLVDTEGRWLFDLARGPLVRATVVRLGDEEHVLLFNMHHIVSDGWSKSVLIRELVAHYSSFAAGEPASLPALGVQTPTLRCGSGSGCRERPSSGSSATGGSSCAERRACSSFPPTGRVHRSRAFAVPTSPSSCPPS